MPRGHLVKAHQARYGQDVRKDGRLGTIRVLPEVNPTAVGVQWHPQHWGVGGRPTISDEATASLERITILRLDNGTVVVRNSMGRFERFGGSGTEHSSLADAAKESLDIDTA